MSRLPKPRIQSAYTTCPPAIARTGRPSGARMKTPFASAPAGLLGAPKRPASSPATGMRSLPRSEENGPRAAAARGAGPAPREPARGDPAALGGEKRGGGARHVAEVMQLAREIGGVIAGERDAQHVRRPACVARGEHALDRGLARGER